MSEWKLNEDGGLVVKDGNPVYVDVNGDEKTVDIETISRLNHEAQSHRQKKEEFEKRLKDFEGLDAKVAREALEKVKTYETQMKLDEGKIDEVKKSLTSQYETEIKEKTESLDMLQKKYDNMIVNNVFANSEFLRNNLAVPRDMFEALYRKNFKVEEGKVCVYDNAGNRMYSKAHPGDYVTPEEGLKILAEEHPNHDSILKANVANGSGASADGGLLGSGRYIKRADFEKLTPVKQTEVSHKIAEGKMQLTD